MHGAASFSGDEAVKHEIDTPCRLEPPPGSGARGHTASSISTLRGGNLSPLHKLTVCEVEQSPTASQATRAVKQRQTLQTNVCCRPVDQHNSMQMDLVIWWLPTFVAWCSLEAPHA